MVNSRRVLKIITAVALFGMFCCSNPVAPDPIVKTFVSTHQLRQGEVLTWADSSYCGQISVTCTLRDDPYTQMYFSGDTLGTFQRDTNNVYLFQHYYPSTGAGSFHYDTTKRVAIKMKFDTKPRIYIINYRMDNPYVTHQYNCHGDVYHSQDVDGADTITVL